MLLARARWFLPTTTLVFLLGQAGAAWAQGAPPLSAAERSQAIEIENAARSGGGRGAAPAAPSAAVQRPPRLASAPADADNRSVVTEIVPLEPLRPPPGGRSAETGAQPAAAAQRRAQITRFDYATGATVRTVVDLNTRAVLGVRSKVNATTPLAPEELEEAKRLFIAAVPGANESLRAAGTAGDPFLHLIPTTPHPSIPRYGHRLVHMWISGPKRTEQYFVDLTTREVVKKR